MRKTYLIPVALFSAALVLVGCSSKEVKEEKIAGLPAWVVMPTLKDGIAATECVPSTGDMSLDKAEAVALARGELSKQLNLRVKAMDETYRHKTEATGGTVTGGTFESVSKQVADLYLKGSRPIKVDYVTIEGKRNLCTMVAIQPDETKKLFDAIIDQSKVSMDPQSRDVMWEEFKAYKAQQRLEEATQPK